MRITCPRCSAEYEVPDSVMPTGGRDVQCSDCGHSWYQLVAKPAPDPPAPEPQTTDRPDPEAVTVPEGTPEESASESRLRRLREALDGHKTRSGAHALNLSQPPELERDQEPEQEPERGSHPAPDTAPDSPSDDPEASDATPEPPEPPAAPEDPETPPEPGPRKRKLDPSVAAVLRAEAEFERNARAHGPAQALEMQPELALEPPARGRRSADSVRDRLALLQAAERGAPGALPGGEETYPDPAGLARSLQHDRPPPPPPAEVVFSKAGLPVRAAGRDLAAIEVARARNEFRWGFAVALAACLLLPVIYVSAPALAGLMPGQSALFEGIVRAGAQMHLALAGAMQDLLMNVGSWMSDVAANAPNA